MTVAARREREREARRGKILDAAEQVFGEKGLDLATMGDIAATAQLGKGTLYLYFETKEALLVGIAVRHQQKLIARYDAISSGDLSGIEMLHGLARAWVEHMSRTQQHLRMVMSRWVSATPLQSEPGDEFTANVRHVFGTVVQAVARAQAEGAVRDDIDPPRLAMHLWSGINGALLTRLKLQCLPTGSPLANFMPELEELVDFQVEALRSHRISRTKQKVAEA